MSSGVIVALLVYVFVLVLYYQLDDDKSFKCNDENYRLYDEFFRRTFFGKFLLILEGAYLFIPMVILFSIVSFFMIIFITLFLLVSKIVVWIRHSMIGNYLKIYKE